MHWKGLFSSCKQGGKMFFDQPEHSLTKNSSNQIAWYQIVHEFTAEKQNPGRYFCHSFRVVPPFSRNLNCCLFSDLIERIISKQMR